MLKMSIEIFFSFRINKNVYYSSKLNFPKFRCILFVKIKKKAGFCRVKQLTTTRTMFRCIDVSIKIAAGNFENTVIGNTHA